jgi:hypothetical protein
MLTRRDRTAATISYDLNIAGRLPGTVLGVAVVAVVSARLLSLLVGLVVLVAVVLTWQVVALPMRFAG